MRKEYALQALGAVAFVVGGLFVRQQSFVVAETIAKGAQEDAEAIRRRLAAKKEKQAHRHPPAQQL